MNYRSAQTLQRLLLVVLCSLALPAQAQRGGFASEIPFSRNTAKIGQVNGLAVNILARWNILFPEYSRIIAEYGIVERILCACVPGQGGININTVATRDYKASVTEAINFLAYTGVNYYSNIPRDLRQKYFFSFSYQKDRGVVRTGYSGGIAYAIAAYSALTNTPVRQDVAMTGNIHQNGSITAVGGITDKLIGALQEGIGTILIPAENVDDVLALPESFRLNTHIILVSSMDHVMYHAFGSYGPHAAEFKVYEETFRQANQFYQKRQCTEALTALGKIRQAWPGDVNAQAWYEFIRKLDITPPVVYLSLPQGATLTGIVKIEIQVTDDREVGMLRLSIDGKRVAQDFQPVDVYLLDTYPLSDGEHILKVDCEDQAGNRQSKQVPFVVDNPPLNVSLSLQEGETLKSIIDVKMQPTETQAFGKMQLLIDDQPVMKYTHPLPLFVYSLDTYPLSDGEHILKVEWEDKKGTAASQQVPFVVENPPLDVVLLLQEGETLSRISDLKIRPSDSNGIRALRLFVDDNPVAQRTQLPPLITHSLDTYPFPNGEHILKVEWEDKKGTVASQQVPFVVDNPPLNVSLSLREGETLKSIIDVKMQPTETQAFGKMQLFIDDQPVMKYTHPLPLFVYSLDTYPLPNGEHTLKIEWEDKKGIAASQQVPFAVENPLPVVNISIQGGATLSGTSNIEFQATDERGIRAVRLFVGSICIAQNNQPLNVHSLDTFKFPNGGHTFRVECENVDGKKVSKEIPFRIDNFTAPRTKTLAQVKEEVGTETSLVGTPPTEEGEPMTVYSNMRRHTILTQGDILELDGRQVAKEAVAEYLNSRGYEGAQYGDPEIKSIDLRGFRRSGHSTTFDNPSGKYRVPTGDFPPGAYSVKLEVTFGNDQTILSEPTVYYLVETPVLAVVSPKNNGVVSDPILVKIFALEGFRFTRLVLINDQNQVQAKGQEPNAQLFLDVSGLKAGRYQYMVIAQNKDGYLCHSRPFSIRVPLKERIEYPKEDRTQ